MNKEVELIKEIITNEKVAIEELDKNIDTPQTALIALKANAQKLEELYIQAVRRTSRQGKRGMTYQSIAYKIRDDLNIPFHRARQYAEWFSKLYKGNKQAITSVIASYTNDGLVKITYTINDKNNELIINKPTNEQNRKKESGKMD